MSLFDRKKSLVDSRLLQDATDRHSHILYGVDDGVATLEESLQCISFYESLGLAHLWLTPHIMEDMPNRTEALKARFRELHEAYVPEGESEVGKVRLHLAAEYMMDAEYEKRLESGDLLTMEDNTVLLETSTWSAPVNFYDMLDRTRSAGYFPLLAHVERYRYLSEADYDRLHEMGVRMQLNIPSVLGGYGENSKRRANVLLARGYYCVCGSDCHRFRNLVAQYQSKQFHRKDLESLSLLLHNDKTLK